MERQIVDTAFRSGDPEFPDTETRQAWYAARRHVMDHLLRLIADSPWNEHLVLRGSLLLKAWLGDTAREPGDIDWVFRPADVAAGSPIAQKLLKNLHALVTKRRHAGNAIIQAHKVTIDKLGPYEQIAGHRIVFPWRAEGLPPGSIQMDIAFGDTLFVDPLPTPIPSPGEGSVVIWAARPDLALAWKLLWLERDRAPRGKDLYDATLLAEWTPLSRALLDRVLQTGPGMDFASLSLDFPTKWNVDWGEFKQEYPWVVGKAIDWQYRLAAALYPLFEQQSDSLA